jgi:CheY-like chemotaxis protein
VPPVDGAESSLCQLFLNLLLNAAQAIPEGHMDENEIRVSTFVDDADRVTIEIGDTGRGIPLPVRERLFTPFFTTKPAGTGLGLTICAHIVGSLGGEITVDSEVGRGSVFRVSLRPSKYLGGQSIAPSQTPSTTPRGRILVVDDEEAVGLYLQHALAREHEVISLTNAREALARIERGDRFDVILCDAMMPIMTGMDFYTLVSRVAPALAGRVIFMTGGTFTQQAHDFLESVPNQSLEKPFEIERVVTMVNEAVRKSRESAPPDSPQGTNGLPPQP